MWVPFTKLTDRGRLRVCGDQVEWWKSKAAGRLHQALIYDFAYWNLEVFRNQHQPPQNLIYDRAYWNLVVFRNQHQPAQIDSSGYLDVYSPTWIGWTKERHGERHTGGYRETQRATHQITYRATHIWTQRATFIWIQWATHQWTYSETQRWTQRATHRWIQKATQREKEREQQKQLWCHGLPASWPNTVLYAHAVAQELQIVLKLFATGQHGFIVIVLLDVQTVFVAPSTVTEHLHVFQRRVVARVVIFVIVGVQLPQHVG